MFFSKSSKQIVTQILVLILLAALVLIIPMQVHADTQQGWNTLPDGRITYMLNETEPATGFVKIGGNWYHFDQNGTLSLGWFTENGQKYYATTSGKVGKKKGALKSGYTDAEGAYYQFSTTDAAGQFGAQQVGWLTVNGKTFYYNADGTKLTGLQEVEGNLYYFAPGGSAKKVGRVKTGWKKINGKKYYFRSTSDLYGAAYRNTTMTIQGVSYSFAEDGTVSGSSDEDSNQEKPSSSGSNKRSSLSASQQRFIERIGALARADMKATGVLASVTVAQAVVESGYGASSLAREANNLFGMKAPTGATSWKSNWDGAYYEVKTQEFLNGSYQTIMAKFKKYPSFEASVADHSAYLTGAKLGDGSLRYEGLVGCKDYRKAATIIKNGGYATAPNYVSVLADVIEKYGLTEFDS